MAELKGSSISLHAHGDGTYHTVSPAGNDYMLGSKDTGRVEHDSFGAAVAHMAKHHAAGSHMHIEDTEDGFTSHHKHENGKTTGPHDHKNLRELKRSLSQFFDEEGQED